MYSSHWQRDELQKYSVVSQGSSCCWLGWRRRVLSPPPAVRRRARQAVLSVDGRGRRGDGGPAESRLSARLASSEPR